MQTLTLHAKTGTSPVLLGESIDRLAAYCPSGRRVIVTDRNVRRLHGARFAGMEVVELAPGESTKTLATVASLYERFLALELERTDWVIGVGGGVVTDLAGFAAATYLRGLSFGFVPTTLLAQVDASIGGKNGVDFHDYKNLVGVIQQPQFCLCDFTLLATLPPDEWRHGFAEVIKAAAIGDAALFAFLEGRGAAVLTLGSDTAQIVHDAARVKVRIVEADERERDARRLLNFGHTVGHAIEAVVRIPHGAAVSLGMVAAARLSVTYAGLSPSAAERLIRLLAAVGLPTDCAGLKLEKAAVLNAIRKDKKRAGDHIAMTLLTAIGAAQSVRVPLAALEASLDALC